MRSKKLKRDDETDGGEEGVAVRKKRAKCHLRCHLRCGLHRPLGRSAWRRSLEVRLIYSIKLERLTPFPSLPCVS